MNIRGYLLTNIIPPEIKSDRYKKNNFVRKCKCHECQTSAAPPPQTQWELQPILPPEEPWYHYGIDLGCNMSRTTLSYLHIVVMVCYLTKFVVALPLKSKT